MNRARILIAMGLPLGACEGEPAHQPDPIAVSTATPSATSEATAQPTASAAPTATADPIPTTTATPTPIATARGLSNVPHFSAEYPFKNNRGCSTAYAHCYLLGDLQKQASAGASCPAHEDVPQGCMGGTPCGDPDARTTGDWLASVSRSQTTVKHAAACCYSVPDLCCAACGRTLRDGDRVVVTPVAARADWASDANANTRSRDAAKARRFSAMAAAEHASIASFARTSLELLALGAPAELIAATHAAAIDEIDHARTCYAIASSLSGTSIGPGALEAAPIAQTTFASFSVSTFIDACVGETLGADQLRAFAFEEADEDIARELVRIAEDEERHAELAFRTLAWAVRAGGDDAREAVRRASAALDDVTRSQRVVREIVLPCTAALLA